MPLPSRTLVSRRATLAAGAAGAAGAVVMAGGCDLDPRAEPGPPGPTSGAPADPGEDADLVLLDEVRTGVIETLALVEATRRRHPALRPTLRPVSVAHHAHDAELAAAGRESAAGDNSPPAVRRDPVRALAQVRARETRLQRQLTEGAIRAGSGGFARLLASMGASVAQHLTLLPQAPST